MSEKSEMPKPASLEHQGRIVRQEVRICATPDQVFEAWADPEKITRWFVDRAEGRGTSGSVMTWSFDHFGYQMPVPIIEATPGRRFVTGGEIPGRPPALMEIDLSREGEITVVRLANSGLLEGEAWEEAYQGVDSGWRLALASLKHQLERYPDRRRTHLLSMRQARFDFPASLSFYTTPAGLDAWLTTRARIDGGAMRPGASVDFEVRDAGRLTGEVLAFSGREVLLEWREQQGVLALKAFTMGPAQRMIALDFCTWTTGAPMLAQAALDGAMERLAARLG